MTKSDRWNRARAGARKALVGGYAGRPEAAGLWGMPKRAVLEIALRLAIQLKGTPDDIGPAVELIKQEYSALRWRGVA